MSAIGTKRTLVSALQMSAFGGQSGHDFLRRKCLLLTEVRDENTKYGGRNAHQLITPPNTTAKMPTATPPSGQAISLRSYLFASLLIVWAADHYRRLTKRLEDEENFRKLAVEELAHQNKLATIQSIIGFQLRDEPQTRDAILRRLSALSATDDLIMVAQGRGARIRDVLSAELRPYGASRISIEGPDCLLSPKLALTMALLAHELATNAAKYGALSNSLGKLSIAWSLSSEELNFEWRESDGPIVTSPTHRGFGVRLLSRALDQFGGTIETTFEPTGLVCKLKVTLPERTPSIVPDITSKGPEVLAAD